MRIEPRFRKPLAPRGALRDVAAEARRRRYDIGDKAIEAVTRQRLDVVYVGHGHKPRYLSISLPRVPRYFEELPS